MNRQNIIITLLSTPLLAFTACSSSDEVSDNGVEERAPIVLSTAITPVTRATTADLQNTQFANGTQIGTFIYRTGKTAEDNSYGYENTPYTADGSGALTPSPQPYFPMQKTAVDIYAYAPYQASPTTAAEGKWSMTGLSVKGDQSTDDGYKASDFVSGSITNLTYANRADADATKMTFKHNLCKIAVKLEAVTTDNQPFSNANLEAARVIMNNVARGFEFNVTTASVTTSALSATSTENEVDMGVTEKSTTSEGTTKASSLTVYAVIPPQTIAANQTLFTIKLDKDVNKLGTTDATPTYALVPSTEQKFEAGKQYTYTVSIDATKLSFTTTITDWVDANENRVGTGKGVVVTGN